MAKYTIAFDEKTKGFTSFFTYEPEGMISLDNNFFSFKNGQLYIHNSDSAPKNNFYGVQYSSKITTVFNQEHQFDKIFKTIVIEGDRAWDVTLVTNYTNSTIANTEFKQKESRWFGYIRQNEETNDLRSVSQGIGNITDVSGGVIVFTSVSSTVSIGDNLYQMNGGIQELIGVITNKSITTITVDVIVTTPIIGLFTFSKKNSRIEGAEIRGYYCEITLEDTTDTANELFAVSSNIVKSYL